MPALATLHPTAVATCQRAGAPTLAGGLEEATLSTIGTPTVGVEDVTADIRRTPDGRDVEVALRLWLYGADVATAWREGDRWAITYRGRALELEAEAVTGPFGSGDADHVEVLAVSRPVRPGAGA